MMRSTYIYVCSIHKNQGVACECHILDPNNMHPICRINEKGTEGWMGVC